MYHPHLHKETKPDRRRDNNNSKAVEEGEEEVAVKEEDLHNAVDEARAAGEAMGPSALRRKPEFHTGMFQPFFQGLPAW